MIDNHRRNLILLGPQPGYQSLKRVLGKLPFRPPVALITAGWETEEEQDHEIHTVVGVPTINLNLFARTEVLFRDDPELIQLLQARQDELRHLRDVYNARLRHQCKAARQLFQREETLIDLTAEKESAIAMIRQLDQQHYEHAGRIIDHYEHRLQTHSRPLVAQHREELRNLLQSCGLLLIAGGHVAILLNRLRIFGILELTPEIPIIAWSGGAMALSERIVFFHDSLPQGFNDAEVLRPGAGLYGNVLPLPDGWNRLNVQDPTRVQMFARRFQGYQTVVLDEHTVLQRHENSWRDYTEGGTRRLGEHGEIVGFMQ